MTRPKSKVRVGSSSTDSDANKIRRQGIEALEKAGIRVFMTKEEWNIVSLAINLRGGKHVEKGR